MLVATQPADLILGEVPADAGDVLKQLPSLVLPLPRTVAAPDAIQAAAALLQTAQRPLVIIGKGQVHRP